MLTLREYSNTLIEDRISVDFIRFDYDIEKAVKAIEKSPSDEFANMPKKAYYIQSFTIKKYL